MSKGFRGFVKGIGIGVTLGCIAGGTGVCCMRKGRRGLKRNAGKVLKSIGTLVDGVMGMF